MAPNSAIHLSLLLSILAASTPDLSWLQTLITCSKSTRTCRNARMPAPELASVHAGSELTLAEDVESFWVADRSMAAPVPPGLLSSSSSSNMAGALESSSSRDLAGKAGAHARVASAIAQNEAAAAPVSDDGAPLRSESGKDASVSGEACLHGASCGCL